MRSVVDHALSLLLFLGMIVEFVWVSAGRDRDVFPDAGDQLLSRSPAASPSRSRAGAQRELVIEPETAPAVPAIEPQPEPKLESAPSATHPA